MGADLDQLDDTRGNFLNVNPELQFEVIRGLSSPIRIRILKLLRRAGPLNVNQIADLVIRAMALKNVERSHTPGKIGWKGDVPVIRLRNARIAKLGWRSHYTSAQAVKATIAALLSDPRL